MKKLIMFIFSVFILIGGIFGYIKYKLVSVENVVLEYLTTEENISEELITSEPFIANLSGTKNWMVSIKIKGDSKIYSYYKNEENKIVLESYNDNGQVEILNQKMN